MRAIIFTSLGGTPLGGQGGSTVTQQVVKRAVLTNDKTITRKLKEWVLALKLERVISKEQILELYLNEAPYGGSLYGAEEASQTFFGKHAADVELPEAAYLAAVLPAPTYYSPYGNHRAALDSRKNFVLQKMHEYGYITAEELMDAKEAVVEFKMQRTTSIAAPHFVFYVRQILEEKYGEDALETGGWRVITTLDADLQTFAEETVLKRALKNTEDFNASNAALIALDPRTGDILSMVGSRDYFDTEIPGAYNVATMAPGRQPGSAFKPFAYAEALIKGYTPETVVFDVHTQFSTACTPDNMTSEDECYAPVNYDNKFRGPMTLRNALAQSINVPAVKVLYLAGLPDTLRLARSMGITTLTDPNRYGLTLVLGGGEVKLLDMASAYGVFANDGVRREPRAILKIEDTAGHVVGDNETLGGRQVLESSVAQKINDMLSDGVAREPLGINSVASFPGRDVAVKTGTTDNYHDAWFLGYTPQFVLGIWAGNNDNSAMERRVSGLIVGPLWHEVMQYMLGRLPNEPFSRAEYDYSALKPVLRGIWQMPGTDGAVHDLLYFVDKDNPNGPAPANPTQDGQYALWEMPVRAWAAANGFTNIR